jgi:hypothetical protein
MRTALAERLLIKIMGWTTDEVSTERPLLQALANFKYDEYQQFSPGIRFIESLVLWLKQFETIEEKKIAYEFFLAQLIFISNAEVYHLLSISFPDIINPLLIQKAARKAEIDPYHIRKIINNDEYKRVSRQTLYIGLSDGSRIDQFRRACQISNEQVTPTYQINKEKSDDMLKELQDSMGNSAKFNSIFLIDDFTASGISYFRPDESKGKIFKFLTALFEGKEEKDNNLKSLVDITDIEIHVLFYVATEGAISSLIEKINTWKTEKGITIEISVQAVQILPNSIKSESTNSSEFVKLIKKYFDDTVIDKHYKKGKYDEPHLGFNECALPLVLSHNTPNNSLPILWLPEDKSSRGLFPRVTRHK